METINFISEGGPVSLQPFVRQQSYDDRSINISERIYQAVLQNNQRQESLDPSPVKRDSWASLCKTSYRPYSTEYLARPKFEAWEQRIRCQGLGARLMIDHHGSEYLNNWTTTHDLSYKILPKGLSGPQLREFNASNKQWRPDQDYTKVYGNQTEYGLTEFMKYKWFIEHEPIRSWRTNHQDSFQPFTNA